MSLFLPRKLGNYFDVFVKEGGGGGGQVGGGDYCMSKIDSLTPPYHHRISRASYVFRNFVKLQRNNLTVQYLLTVQTNMRYIEIIHITIYCITNIICNVQLHKSHFNGKAE